MKTMNRRLIGPVIGIGIASMLVYLGWWLLQGKQFDVLAPGGDIADQQRNLFIFTVSLISLVVVPVFVMLGIFAWKYSEKNKKGRYDPSFTHSVVLESIWWGIPIAIIGVLSVVTIQTSHSLDPYKKIISEQETINVQVVALQWKWLFIYPELGVASLNQLPIPEDTPISFTITADAPMSSFWVPALGSQVYAMSGMNSQLNLIASKQGDFRGYSTNINGVGYSDMTMMVHAWDKKRFDAWVSDTKLNKPDIDTELYEELAAPSKNNQELAYNLNDSSLYGSIVKKYTGSNKTDDEPMQYNDGTMTHESMR